MTKTLEAKLALLQRAAAATTAEELEEIKAKLYCLDPALIPRSCHSPEFCDPSTDCYGCPYHH